MGGLAHPRTIRIRAREVIDLRICHARRQAPSVGDLSADAFLELTTELAVQSLRKGIVSKETDRCIPPRKRPRAGEIARTPQQLRGDGRRRRVEDLRLVNIFLVSDHVPRHPREHVYPPSSRKSDIPATVPWVLKAARRRRAAFR